jgi:hypothetical protein
MLEYCTTGEARTFQSSKIAMDRTDVAADAAPDEQEVDTAALAATEAALHSRGLVLLSHAPLVICRAIDTCQTDPVALDVSCCGLQECCLLEVGAYALQPGHAQLRN